MTGSHLHDPAMLSLSSQWTQDHPQQEAALWPLRIHRPSAKPLCSHSCSQTTDHRHLTSWKEASFDFFILLLQRMPGLCLLYTAQRCVRTQQVAAGPAVPWDICGVASDLTLTRSLNLRQSGEYHSPLPGDSLRTYLLQLEYFQRLCH